jgi:hypothetical protein
MQGPVDVGGAPMIERNRVWSARVTEIVVNLFHLPDRIVGLPPQEHFEPHQFTREAGS